MRKVLNLTLISLLLFAAYSCDTTEPTEDKHGRRDYEWTVDTIYNPWLVLSKIWGTSPSNIWGVGFGDISATHIWHFDGTKWNTDSVVRMINPTAIYGFVENEVWLGNYNSTIWKFNGSTWSQVGKYIVDGYDDFTINNFYGNSANDIYGVGAASNNDDIGNIKAIIMHYNGINWQFVKIPEMNVSFYGVRIDKKTGILVITGHAPGFIGKVYTWNGKELKEIFSGSGPAVSNINDQVYITSSQKIYRYKNGGLELWMDKSGTNLVGTIWGGRSEKDFFWNFYGGLAHYNGIDFQEIYHTNLQTDLGISGGLVFEKDVFFVVKDWDRTDYNLIIHGKLKEGGN